MSKLIAFSFSKPQPPQKKIAYERGNSVRNKKPSAQHSKPM